MTWASEAVRVGREWREVLLHQLRGPSASVVALLPAPTLSTGHPRMDSTEFERRSAERKLSHAYVQRAIALRGLTTGIPTVSVNS